jgi:hypothetical protein
MYIEIFMAFSDILGAGQSMCRNRNVGSYEVTFAWIET